ncbi:N-acetylglucosamine-1-phosphotransferase subunits alpha/beta [Hypsibius exemplaris]|uniref:N-acetylglucosamine-1-phosphotransferase subunits alpha/beta n=1 Tax=Hypsibius exemplaris TaxID=2072580 RepID=A0A1W0WZD2_HYPEX|nr:N-acetylglucosamine-1-phosphotransferase subunits alpha/beta [Hypsibius exemplaris]
MLPLNLRKLLHQHVIDLLHSQKALAVTIVTLVLLVISVLQLSETVLEWSVDKYRLLERSSGASNNILGRSFERQLCYNVPIDVVYTWVNGSDPWHQEQMELYRNTAAAGRSNGSHSDRLAIAERRNADLSHFGDHQPLPTDESGKIPQSAQCGSSYCVQARAVILTPTITLPDLSEILDDIPTPNITAYTLANANQTFALVEESFDLDGLLEERSLLVNDRKFTFHSAHLTARAKDIPEVSCVKVEFVRMVINVGADVRKEELEGALPWSLRTKLRRVDFYRSKHLAIVYFEESSGLLRDLKVVRTITLGDGRQVDVAEVCLLGDIQPSALDNEMRLSRFKDNEELRYSIRSLEKHAGWVRRIYIVTNGQVPHWLDLDNSRVQIVTHEEIFLNKSHLPTFSSSAIESHLHRIPGLSEKFLYFNDDVLLTQDVLPEDFFSHSEGYKVHLSWHVPACAEGCPAGWIRDGFCDSTCNNAMCSFDGGDCVNKTVIPDVDDDDDFTSGESFIIGTCRPGCLNAWLADRYCDAVCNHPECAFDAGDCGLDKLTDLPVIQLIDSISVYKSPVGAFAVLFNASGIVANKNVTLKEGTYKQAKGIRTVAVYPKKGAIVMLLHLNATGSTVFTLSYSSEDDAALTFEVTVYFDSTPADVTEAPVEEDELPAENLITFLPIPEDKRSPNPILRESADIAGLSPAMTVERLLGMFHAGDLTEYGLEKRRAALLGITMNSSYTRLATSPRTSTTVIESAVTTITNVKFHDEAETWTQKLGRGSGTTKMVYGRPKYKTKSGLQYKDAYADSLRHVNRLYNDAFGIESRKVPGHVPHFVDRRVMEELQKKFAVEFDETSGTRIRSPNDMQFAFSYFHYVMNVQDELEMSELFDEIDTDHSGSWNVLEIYLAAVKSSDDELTDSQLRDFRGIIQNCTRSFALGDQPAADHLTLPDALSFEISKKDVLACDGVKKALAAQLGKSKRFKFRTSADMEAFTFIRVSNNASLLRKQLHEVMRHPKKYVCLNDEVDYTREDASTIQIALRQFFQTLYPLSSAFELSHGGRNSFSHIEKYRAWKWQSELMRLGLISSAGMLVLIFLCLLFPRRRRLIVRRVRLWMRNRDIDRAMILHT